MSQIEPYGYSQMPPEYDDDEFEPMQMRGGGGSSWQPGWRPPSQQHGCGPPWQGGPGPGGWPFWGYWGFRLRSAWRDVKFLNKLIGDVVNEMIDNGIVAPGPNYVPGPCSTVPSQPTGVKGVTDGSDAGPGMVGEFVTGNGTFAFTGAVGTSSGTVSPVVIQPGDWDIRATAMLTAGATNFSIQLSPVPSGMSNTMTANSGIGSFNFMDMYGILLVMARGNFSVPTLLPFNVVVFNQAAATAGTVVVSVEARRMR